MAKPKEKKPEAQAQGEKRRTVKDVYEELAVQVIMVLVIVLMSAFAIHAWRLVFKG